MKFKKILYWILFPFVFLWIALGVGIMYLGDGLHWIGNAMTGFRADRTFAKISFER